MKQPKKYWRQEFMTNVTYEEIWISFISTITQVCRTYCLRVQWAFDYVM